MKKLTNGMAMVMMLLLALALGPGCQEAKPPLSPKAVAFQKEIQAVIQRIGPPLIYPVACKEMKVVQKELEKAFSLCDAQCEGIFYNVFILDKNGVLTAVYPPAEVKRFQFSNYKAVKKAFAERKPNQTIFYQPDGTVTYIVCLPLIYQEQVVGILALGFEGSNITKKRGVTQEEFLKLHFLSPERSPLEKPGAKGALKNELRPPGESWQRG